MSHFIAWFNKEITEGEFIPPPKKITDTPLRIYVVNYDSNARLFQLR